MPLTTNKAEDGLKGKMPKAELQSGSAKTIRTDGSKRNSKTKKAKERTRSTDPQTTKIR